MGVLCSGRIHLSLDGIPKGLQLLDRRHRPFVHYSITLGNILSALCDPMAGCGFHEWPDRITKKAHLLRVRLSRGTFSDVQRNRRSGPDPLAPQVVHFLLRQFLRNPVYLIEAFQRQLSHLEILELECHLSPFIMRFPVPGQMIPRAAILLSSAAIRTPITTYRPWSIAHLHGRYSMVHRLSSIVRVFLKPSRHPVQIPDPIDG
jgi:hypothetical protein